MWNDTIILTRLEIRRAKKSADYWLRLIGFDNTGSRLYQLYVAGFWMFWVFAMWSFGVDQVYQASYHIPAKEATTLLDMLPFLIYLLQLVYLIKLLQDPPLKLVSTDLSYIATSPVSRSVITLIRCVRGLVIPTVVISLAGILAAMFFAWRFNIPDVGIKGLQTGGVTFLLVVLTVLIGWMIGLLKQNQQNLVFWLTVPVFLLGVRFLPQVFLWSGQLWVATSRGELNFSSVSILSVSLIAALAGLLVAGNKMNMTRVMSQSQIYARVQKLGFWGGLLSRDVIDRIHHQTALTKKQRPQGNLPTTFNGDRVLYGQSYLMMLRLSPRIILRLSLAGMISAATISAIIMFGGYRSLQTWVLVFILILQLRPREVTRLFNETIHQPFLRQFLPHNHLTLLMTQALLPLVVFYVGVSVAILVQPLIAPVLGLLLALALVIALVLCQALEIVRQSFFSYEYAVIFLGAVIVAAGYVFQNVWVALSVTLVVDAGLAWLLFHSRAILNT